MMNFLKGGANIFKKIVMGVKNAIKFFATTIGHVVLYLVAALLLAVLVYIIGQIFAAAFATLLGLDQPGANDQAKDLAFLSSLEDSGYSDMLSADNLIRYYSYEYAVLMDAARYLEETGTTELEKHDESPVDFEKINRAQWAYLAAIQFALNQEIAPGVLGSSEEERATYEPEDYIPSGDPTTKYTMGDPEGESGDSGDLFYEKKYNQYTKEYSLQPYLRVNRENDTLKYFFEIRDGSDTSDTQTAFFQNDVDTATNIKNGTDIGGSNPLDNPSGITYDAMLKLGRYFNLDNISMTIGGVKYTGRELLGCLFRFEGGLTNGLDVSSAAAFIYRYVWPLRFNADLNHANVAAFTTKDVRYSSDLGQVDLNQDNFAQELYYLNTRSITHYNIPLRVLLDRFLPNASLLSAWRLLSEDENKNADNETIVDDIIKIYDDACLTDEEYSGDKILLKDVSQITSKINEKTKASDLLGKTYLKNKEEKLDNYYDKSKTNTAYASYLPLWDTRSGDEEEATTGGTPAGGESTKKQSFKGTCLTDDIVDDIKLILTHYAKDSKVTMEKAFVDKIVSDISTGKDGKPIFDEEKTDGKEEITVYRRTNNGGAFLIKCEGESEARGGDYNTIRSHYGISKTTTPNDESIVITNGAQKSTIVTVDSSTKSHTDVGNPYTNETYRKCLIPYLKFTFKIEKGIKKTAVIIYDNQKYYGYVMIGKEIKDYSNISNKHTLVEMEATTLKSTTFKHWELAQNGSTADKNEISDECWIVTDAFEGLGLDIGMADGNNGFKFHWYMSWTEAWPACYGPEDASGNKPLIHSSDTEKHDYTEDVDFPLDDVELLEDLGISGDFFLRIVLFGKDFKDKKIEEEFPGQQIFWPKDSTAIVRTPSFGNASGDLDTGPVLDALGKARDYHVPVASANPLDVPYCDSYTPNANIMDGALGKDALADDGSNRYGGEATMTEDPGETLFTDKMYLKFKELGITTESTDALKKLTLSGDTICEIVKDYLNEDWETKKYIVYKYYLWKNYRDVIPSYITGPRDPAFKAPEVVNSCMDAVALKKLEEYADMMSQHESCPTHGGGHCSKCTITVHPVELKDHTQVSGGELPFWVNAINEILTLSVVMPTRMAVCPITQRVLDKTMHGYFVKNANYWAAIKDIHNKEIIEGEFKNRDNYFYLITNNGYAEGLKDIDSKYRSVSWRTGLFAPIFGGLNSSEQQREDDVKMIYSEWETVGNSGVNAADHAIRDLDYLIKYSKGIKKDQTDIKTWKASGDPTIDPTFAWQPELCTNKSSANPSGDPYPYVNYNSFTYMYVPDEILEFDELTSEKIFWIDRLIAVPQDPINDDYENKMRSRLNTFTWQVVDYDLYKETLGDDGNHKVYALWLFGDQVSRDLYSFDSNANVDENSKVSIWGGFSIAHKAADLYGRSQTQRIYNTAYGSPSGKKEKEVFNEFYGYAYNKYSEGEAGIKVDVDGSKDVVLYSKGSSPNHSNSSVDLTGASDVSGEFFYFGDNGNIESLSLTETNAGSDLLYSSGATIKLRLGGKDYTFNGPASASYGYNLFMLASQLGDADLAEQELKSQLEKEMEWQEVRAVAPGIVRNIVSNAVSGFGVIITHTGIQEGTNRDSETITTAYCHMKRYPMVQVGQYVGAGTVLGYEGTTGKSGGYHCHMNLKIGNGSVQNGRRVDDARSPARFMYPFFTPFWYQEKAEENLEAVNGNPLQSGYFSLNRTAFPYGQIVPSDLASVLRAHENEGEIIGDATNETKASPIKTASVTSELMGLRKSSGTEFVDIKNYTPQNALVDDASRLKTKDDEGEFAVPSTGSEVHRIGGSTYNGETLRTNPDYIDEDFIKDVYDNNQKISGVPSRALQ
ncbi:MAG: M23 family metallopeptidase [Clostridia bacterium]|nr:M23 family metallopeptidase [Clostridia bacterium]